MPSTFITTGTLKQPTLPAVLVEALQRAIDAVESDPSVSPDGTNLSLSFTSTNVVGNFSLPSDLLSQNLMLIPIFLYNGEISPEIMATKQAWTLQFPDPSGTLFEATYSEALIRLSTIINNLERGSSTNLNSSYNNDTQVLAVSFSFPYLRIFNEAEGRFFIEVQDFLPDFDYSSLGPSGRV